MKQIAPQINELCEEVMSQSKTPRTDAFDNEWIKRGRYSDRERIFLMHARTLESEVSRLQEEKAEVERELRSVDERLSRRPALDDVPNRLDKIERCINDTRNADSHERHLRAAESALLQAREDAQRYRFLRERTAGSVHHNDHWIDFHYEVNATQPHTNDLIWLQTHWAAQQLDIAIDAARQAQEGEKG